MAYPSHLDSAEREIIDRAIRDVLDSGHMISVHDGEEYAIRRSRDYAAITAEIAATCETTLVIESLDRHRVGWVWLIHGNGCDVIADYTQSVDALMTGANALAEQFSDPTMEAYK